MEFNQVMQNLKRGDTQMNAQNDDVTTSLVVRHGI
jgi:hypothetical protein